MLWFWDYQGRKQGEGLLARLQWPRAEVILRLANGGAPSFLGILFCVLDHGYGGLRLFWSLVAPPRGQDRAGHPTGPLPWDPGLNTSRAGVTFVCRNVFWQPGP